MPIAIQRTDGGVSIMYLLENVKVADEVKKWEESSGFKAASYASIEENEINSLDSEYRDAWTIEGGTLRISMPKACPIFIGKIRVKRDAALAKLDIEVSKAIAKGETSKAAELEAKRQALRDITDTYKSQIEEASTLKALKDIEIIELKG